MRITSYTIIIILIGFLISPVRARPISYEGGWTSIFENNNNLNKIHIHFSPSHKTSVGINLEYWHDEEFLLNTIQINNLINRWNKKNSQASF